MRPPFAFIFSIPSGLELVLILLAALMIFGGRLPEVAMRAAAHIMRARRAVTRMWRETGLEDELRRVQRDIENAVPRDADFDIRPRNPARIDDPRAAAQRAREAARQAEEAVPADAIDPDADRAEPFTIEPSEDLIADGDDWRPPEQQGTDTDHGPHPQTGEGPTTGFGAGVDRGA